MWATSAARHLRPYLAPLYKDLRSAKGALKQIHRSQWQLALAMLSRRACAAKHWSFMLPAASDNAPTEAGLDKLWSTAEPLGSFLQLAAAWAAKKHHVDFQVSHLAGEKNTWADALPRNKPNFQHRAAQRCRFPLPSFLGLQGCITLRPAEAAWPDEIRAPQRPQA